MWLFGFCDAGAFNIPTATVDPVTGLFTPEPSPLCINGSCAHEFEDKLLQIEEFGLKNMSDSSTSAGTLPVPTDCNGIPDGPALDHFLKEDLNSVPTPTANETLANPWVAKVKDCLGLPADMAMPADGRPGGEWFAHRRWDEFYTQAPRLAWFQTAMTGARVNGGLRDKK